MIRHYLSETSRFNCAPPPEEFDVLSPKVVRRPEMWDAVNMSSQHTERRAANNHHIVDLSPVWVDMLNTREENTFRNIPA